MHTYATHLDQTHACNTLAHAEHLYISATRSHIKHGLNIISEMLTNVTFVGHTQQFRHQTRIKINNILKLTNACNIINTLQWNGPVENWYKVISHQINKFAKKVTITKSR